MGWLTYGIQQFTEVFCVKAMRRNMFCILWPQKQLPLQSACVLAVAGQLKRSRIELGNQLLGPSLVRFVSEDTPPHFQIAAFQETIFFQKNNLFQSTMTS